MYKEYNLTPEDYFKSPQGWMIIVRSGIDKIQAIAKIQITYDVIQSSEDLQNVLIKAKGSMNGGTFIETFGEATPSNCKQKYKASMAEKRAMSRVVLKLTGFYESGAFGEDESDDFKKN